MVLERKIYMILNGNLLVNDLNLKYIYSLKCYIVINKYISY